MEPTYNGAEDNRSQIEKAQDYQWIELNNALGSQVSFEERVPVGYTPRNQASSNSCVAQTTAKMIEIWDYKHDNIPTIYSATPIYQYRTLKAPGMNAVDALGHPKNKGTWLEKDVPSQMMSDDQIDAATVPANVVQQLRPTNYVQVPHDFYTVAQEVERTGAVMMWIKCSYQEWSRDVPEGLSDSEAVRHSVTVVDKILFDSVEYLIIEDSWGTWLHGSNLPLKAGQRAITKQFFDKHCYYAASFTAFHFGDETMVTKPKYKFEQAMSFSYSQKDPVKVLQDILKYEGLFPLGTESTGRFLSVTARALKAWQIKHGIMDFANENDMTKIRAGLKTIMKLNELYSN